MEKFYVCGPEDREDIVNVISMDHNAHLYGIDTVSTGIRSIQIKRISATLDGEFPNSRVIGHRIDDKFIGFGVQYMWPGMPAWSLPIAYTSYDYVAGEKLAYSYKNIIMNMMDYAEAQQVYNYYFVSAHAPGIRKDGFRFRRYSRSDLFPKYEHFYEELIPPNGNSRYEIFQNMLTLVAGKNRRPLVIVHGHCRQEHRTGPV